MKKSHLITIAKKLMTSTFTKDNIPEIVSPPFRFQWEEVQNCYVVLYPEGMVKLSQSAGEIMRRCDGEKDRQAGEHCQPPREILLPKTRQNPAPARRGRLNAETEHWGRLTRAVGLILDTAKEAAP